MEKCGYSSSSWSEHVEDLVENGDVEKAISVLESQIQTLTETKSSQLDNLGLSSAFSDLAHIYSSKGFSIKADKARFRARDLKLAVDSNHNIPAPSEASASEGMSLKDGHLEKSSESGKTVFPGKEFPDDDWEAMADRASEELLSSQIVSDVSERFKEKVVEVQPPKRRGRGTFSYTTHGLHNKQQSGGLVIDSSKSETAGQSSERDTTTRAGSYGTRHVVVLSDFPPSTTTINLEKLLKNFKGRGVVIRWVNDTVALAVFKSPIIALEVCNQIQCPFTMRVLDENDPLLNSILPGDLEPPRERPRTSTSAATRLIAQGMGINLPTAGFGSKELKKQEQARRNRIVSRQNMRDDAWGDDM